MRRNPDRAKRRSAATAAIRAAIETPARAKTGSALSHGAKTAATEIATAAEATWRDGR
jgi:hypothetical protein